MRPSADKQRQYAARHFHRFWSKVDRSNEDGCWLWTGGKLRTGYGIFMVGSGAGKTSTTHYAHRWAYLMAYGQFPTDYEIDHLCRNPSCVRSDHLEAVTPAENKRRAAIAKTRTACPAGHLYDEKNTRRDANGAKRCRACNRDSARARHRLTIPKRLWRKKDLP